MRKTILGLALLAPTALTAQIPFRGQSGYDTGPVVNCTALDGTGNARCLIPGAVIYDTNGNPLGTAANPVVTSSTGSTGTPTGTAGSPNANVVTVQGIAGGTSQAVNQPDSYGSGTINSATANATYTITPANGQSVGGFVITGLTASGATLTAESSYDGTNYVSTPLVQVGAKTLSATITADGQYRFEVSGRRGFRLRVSTAGTGSVTVASALSIAGFLPPSPTLNADGSLNVVNLPSTNLIGGVNNAQVNGVAIATGAGASSTGTQRVVLSSDSAIANTGFNNTDNITAVGGAAITLGQKTQANSVPVTLASDGSYATAANQTNGSQVARSTGVFATLPSAVASGSQQQIWTGSRGQQIVGSYNTSLADGAVSPANLGAEVSTSDQVVGHAVIPFVALSGQTYYQRGDATGTYTVSQPVPTASAGVAVATVASATSQVGKAAAGNAYTMNVENAAVTGTYVIIYDASAAPAAGATLTAGLIRWHYLLTSGGSLDKSWTTPLAFANGITVLYSTSLTTFTAPGTAPTLSSIGYK